MKLIAFGKTYFRDGWNLFDFFIVALSNISLILTYTSGFSLGSSASVIRSFRVGRVFRLINKAKKLRLIFNTLLITLPALANIGGLLFLFLFIYSIIGMNLFPYVKFQEHLNEDANFQNFGTTLLMLLRMATGEGWNYLYFDASRSLQPNFACQSISSYEEYIVSGTESVF